MEQSFLIIKSFFLQNCFGHSEINVSLPNKATQIKVWKHLSWSWIYDMHCQVYWSCNSGQYQHQYQMRINHPKLDSRQNEMVAGAPRTLNQYCGVNSRPQDHVIYESFPASKLQISDESKQRGAAALANFKWWKLTQTEPTLCNGESRNTLFLFLGKHFSYFSWKNRQTLSFISKDNLDMGKTLIS